MLLNSVVIILREVLEAALLMSVFLASARFLQTRNSWAISALVAGAIGAATYGFCLEPVSDFTSNHRCAYGAHGYAGYYS